jgi:HEAT repeat protein
MCAVRSSGIAVVAALGVLCSACTAGDPSSADPEQRALAVRALGARRDRNDLTRLLLAQRDLSPVVRRAAAEAFAAREGPEVADALGALLADGDAAVVAVAAAGLAARPGQPRAREQLVLGYAQAGPAGRAAIADALQSVGTSLREAVEHEARALWERNLSALASQGRARVGAAEELGASARADAVARLLPLLDPKTSADRELAASAARGLGEAGDRTARPRLEQLLEEGDGALAVAAADALGRLGDPAAADVLAAIAGSGSGPVATAAVAALVTLPHSPEVGLALCEVANRASDPAVAAGAARAARERDAACPVKPLVARLGKPGSLSALAALAALRPGGADGDAATQRLLTFLDPARNPDQAVRVGTLRALGRMRSPQAGAAVKERAVALGARLGAARTRWIAGQLSATATPELAAGGEARLAAVLARPPGPREGGAPGEPALPTFVPVAPGDAEELGAALAECGRLRVPGAEALLSAGAADPEPAVRAGAAEGLGELGGGAALPALTRALSDPSPAVREAAVVALVQLGAQGAAVLVQASQEPRLSPEWCARLARALGDTGEPTVVPALSTLLDGSCPAEAADALGRVGAAAAVPPLLAALDRPAAAGKVEIVDALGQLAAEPAAAALVRELSSDRPQVRAAAARALAALRHEPASSRLEALRSDYYGRVRRAAVEALSKLPSGAPRGRQ